jgi:hypothetical protein
MQAAALQYQHKGPDPGPSHKEDGTGPLLPRFAIAAIFFLLKDIANTQAGGNGQILPFVL